MDFGLSLQMKDFLAGMSPGGGGTLDGDEPPGGGGTPGGDGTPGGGEGTPGVSAEIQITRRSALQIAPEGVFFEVSLAGFDTLGPSGGQTYDARLHDIYYYWDYGDSYTYSTPAKVPGVHRNSGYSYGSLGAHVYRSDGTYTVTCTVIEPASGKTAVTTLQVTVGNPDTVFTANNQTIVVDTIGIGLAAYPNATVVTSIDSAIAVIKGYDDDTKPCRVIIRRGQIFTLTASTNFGKKSRWPSTHWLAANEAGPVPTINSTNGDIFWNDLDTTGNGNDKDWILQGLKFIGGWNPQTESGTTNNGIQLQGNPPQQFLLDGVTLQDFGGRNFSTTQVNAPYHVFLNDCYLDGWRFYGIYMSGVQVCAITGSVLEQDPLANAGGPKDGAHNNHGPCRIASAGGTKALVHSSEFYSRNDWFQAGGWWGQQPNFRFDTSGIGGAKLNMQSNVLEGGTNIMVFGAESGASNRAINATIEKNYFLASHSTRKGVALAKGGVTFRNNIIVFPDTPQNSGFEASSFITSSWDGEVAGEQNEPINIYNNTMVNLLSSELTELNTSGWAALTNRNNLIYQPNTGSPQTADGPLDMTQAFMPTELGYKDSDTPLQAAYATPPSSVAIYAPLPESEALGDAMNGAVAYDDFYGNERPQYPSRGALETP